MINMKNIKKPKHIKSILAIDPGTTNMGWAYAHTNLNTGEFLVYDYGVIKPVNLLTKEKAYRGIFEDRILKVDIVDREYSALIEHFKADYHASESAFFHSRSPEAYASLSICIHTLSTVLFRYYKSGFLTADAAILRRFAPRHIKKTVSLDGTSDKEKIQTSIKDNTQIKFIVEPDKLLSEHEADAIGCAYTFAQILPTQIVNS